MWEISRGYGNQSVTAVPKAQINHDAPVLCTDFSTDGTVVFSGGASKQARHSTTCAMKCMPRASSPLAASAAGARSTGRCAAALAVRDVVKHDAVEHAVVTVAVCEFELVTLTPKKRVAVSISLHLPPPPCFVYRIPHSFRRDILIFFFFIFQLAEPFRESAVKKHYLERMCSAARSCRSHAMPTRCGLCYAERGDRSLSRYIWRTVTPAERATTVILLPGRDVQ